MDIHEVFRRRHSVRKYSSRAVPEEAVQRCLDAARLAPSWRNGQPWHFIVVRDPDTIQKLMRTGSMGGAANLWLKDAPVVLVACAEPRISGDKDDQPYYLVDVAIALEHAILAATAEGLGTCWMGGFSEDKVRQVLGIPQQIPVVAMTPLGYPADEKGFYDRVAKVGMRLRRRRSLEEIVRYEKW